MKTANDVLNAIDEHIESLERKAAQPCITALLDDVDRETYRDAVKAGTELRAIQELRNKLGAAITSNGSTRRKRK